VENWLVRMLRHARQSGAEVVWIFYCTVGEPGDRAVTGVNPRNWYRDGQRQLDI